MTTKSPTRKFANFAVHCHGISQEKLSVVLDCFPGNGRRQPFRQPFFGHFQSRTHVPPAAGQLGRNPCAAKVLRDTHTHFAYKSTWPR